MIPILPLQSGREVVARRPRVHRLGLRSRTALALAVGALAVALSLAVLTYLLAGTYLLRQRESFASRQTFVGARLARDVLQAESPDVAALVETLAGESESDLLVHFDGQWYSSSVELGETTVPVSLRDEVRGGVAGKQRFELDDRPHLAVGLPLGSTGAEYFEIHSLGELQRTLATLRTSLVVAASLTAAAAAASGLVVSRRVMRPLRDVSAASVDIANGQLATRLRNEDDPDLAALVRSFNLMAEALEQRIERETRFASNVSHELRTPLTALSNAVQILSGRAADLTPRARTAVAIIESQVAYFEQLVLDLLEISRLDAGVEQAHAEAVDVGALIVDIVARHSDRTAVEIEGGISHTVHVDPVRLERVLANLLDNASHYAGGATVVRVRADDSQLRIEVDDDGPGIAEAERLRVFERFHRGAQPASRATKGTGLGLSLVREHLELMGGAARVESSPSGGARFVVLLPLDGAC